MPEARVSLDVVPAVAQPAKVSERLAEAIELRNRVRAAQEQTASAQAALDEAERQDVASAAQRAREGQALGTPPVSVRKAREALDLRKRDHAALVLAQTGAEIDLAAALAETADVWASALDKEIEAAREHARHALDEFQQAMGEISTTSTAALWLSSGRSDGRWDRRPALAFAGTVAMSSRARTINGEPMPVSELVGYLNEALEPPTSTQTSASTIEAT